MYDRLRDLRAEVLDCVCASVPMWTVALPISERRFFWPQWHDDPISPAHDFATEQDFDEFEFDDGIDADSVEREIRRFHAKVVEFLHDAGREDWFSDGTYGYYYVATNGVWHVDLWQLYLALIAVPNLAPLDWIKQKVLGFTQAQD